jgi:hypothetical protein
MLGFDAAVVAFVLAAFGLTIGFVSLGRRTRSMPLSTSESLLAYASATNAWPLSKYIDEVAKAVERFIASTDLDGLPHGSLQVAVFHREDRPWRRKGPSGVEDCEVGAVWISDHAGVQGKDIVIRITFYTNCRSSLLHYLEIHLNRYSVSSGYLSDHSLTTVFGRDDFPDEQTLVARVVEDVAAKLPEYVVFRESERRAKSARILFRVLGWAIFLGVVFVLYRAFS